MRMPDTLLLGESSISNGLSALELEQKSMGHGLQNGHTLSKKLKGIIITEKNPKCYGKVKDLESMVPLKWWKTVFADDMYLKTDGDVVEDPAITTEEVNLLLSDPHISSLLSNSCIDSTFTISHVKLVDPIKTLDLCCGQGRHSIHMSQRFPLVEFYGHDQSAYLITLAKERALAHNVSTNTHFTVGDCQSIPYADENFDLVLVMGNSFGYFASDDGDKTVLKEINRVLRPGGMIIIDLTDGEYMKLNFSQRSWEWMDDTTFACRERQLSKDGQRLVSREVISDTRNGVLRDQFYQERLYSRLELFDLMKELGFHMALVDNTAVEIITAAKELSKRNEDLGMMEQRMLIKATKIVSTMATGYTDLVKKKLPFPHVSILLGDTTKKCTGKLNNTWNKEDLDTRQILMDALFDIGYDNSTINIISNHDNLLQELSNNKNRVIFNLCDEGFLNDALKELHVPALLEMLHIPYTGAGPTCLAICYDKGLVSRSAEALGIHIPKEAIYLTDTKSTLEEDLEHVNFGIDQNFKYPAFVKPMKGDNSLGITTRSIVNDKQQLSAYMAELNSMGIRDIIIQEYLRGTEYSVGMIGNSSSGFKFFPVLEVDYDKILEKNLPPILGFESKWQPESPYWTDISYKKAVLSKSVEKYLHTTCIKLWERFECRDYARFDFRCDIGKGDGFDGKGGLIKLLEANPNPGWCWDGKLTYMAKMDGFTYSDVIRMILEAASERLSRESI